MRDYEAERKAINKKYDRKISAINKKFEASEKIRVAEFEKILAIVNKY